MIPAGRQPITLTGPFRAVQGDTAVTCVDWQAFHSWRADDPAFIGLVTVMDDHDSQVTAAEWASPTDDAADCSLRRTGWHRTGPWVLDPTGRRSAPVQRGNKPPTGA
jgi:hypothetical protein